MIQNKLMAPTRAKGFIFDGFPRTRAQAEALDRTAHRHGLGASPLMLALEVDEDEW
jgi:adenylate kinase